MDFVAFLAKHTWIQLRYPTRVFAPSDAGPILAIALKSLRQATYGCEICFKADERRYGVAHWRRTHQIPGLFWCPKHKVHLAWTYHPDALMHSPRSVDWHRPTEIGENWINALASNETIKKYVEMQLQLLTPTAASKSIKSQMATKIDWTKWGDLRKIIGEKRWLVNEWSGNAGQNRGWSIHMAAYASLFRRGADAATELTQARQAGSTVYRENDQKAHLLASFLKFTA